MPKPVDLPTSAPYSPCLLVVTCPKARCYVLGTVFGPSFPLRGGLQVDFKRFNARLKKGLGGTQGRSLGVLRQELKEGLMGVERWLVPIVNLTLPCAFRNDSTWALSRDLSFQQSHIMHSGAYSV